MGLFSSEPPSHFPAVKGRRLDGTDVRFPRDLPADATLLIVSFRDELDSLSDQWARLGDRIAEHRGGRFAAIEVPVVNSKLKLLGGLATVGIRGQVETDAEHARTIPIYANVKTFRKRLQVSAGDVHAILVARDGRIMWRGDGDIDMDEVAELEAAIDETLRQPVPPYTDHPDVDIDDEDALADDASAADDGGAAPDAAEPGGESADAAESADADGADADGADAERINADGAGLAGDVPRARENRQPEGRQPAPGQ